MDSEKPVECASLHPHGSGSCIRDMGHEGSHMLLSSSGVAHWKTSDPVDHNPSDYVVIRPGSGLPRDFMPPGLDGKWFDRALMGPRPLSDRAIPVAFGEAVAVPSGRFEVRDDGAVAEVWEVRP